MIIDINIYINVIDVQNDRNNEISMIIDEESIYSKADMEQDNIYDEIQDI